MLFNSLFFLFVFFPIVGGFYYLLPHKFRWAWLLLASCYFYMSFIPGYILILAITITIDYFAAIFIGRSKGHSKRFLLILSILANIGMLFIFKYFNFFNTNIISLAEFFHWNYSIENLKLILPIGLSFHTFQSLSYIIEVYRGRQKVERHFGIFAVYVLFFPQLVAGPIERPQNLLHQFYEKHYFRLEQFMSGMRLIIWGLFKKVVIADRASVFVDQIFNNVNDFTGPYFALATFLFAFQIYCDFSGYSDMARGIARTLGFELMVNFRSPYFSRSISEFWTRWHISLSTWFRDYVYVPLGGNRVSSFRWTYNLFIVFLLSGIWHGANWTYVVWGAMNGFYLIFSIWTKKIRSKIAGILKLKHTFLEKALQLIVTFLLIEASWIFFRAQSLGDAWYILKQIFIEGYKITSLQPFIQRYNYSIGIIFAAIILLILVDYFIAEDKRAKKLQKISMPLQVFAYSFLVFIIILLGQFSNEHFIYFQF
ncbi:MBOAT family protein [Candidatus Parcubacteria bacterium]|jgi:alginate O-acetyltransferase complex protein AlgI|nr:MBOAT family protein [Candidatus Parcubacteria bacterium]MBT7228623.1 MBOAT family protein [Candidatus Parcubacteria bacterium]